MNKYHNININALNDFYCGGGQEKGQSVIDLKQKTKTKTKTNKQTIKTILFIFYLWNPNIVTDNKKKNINKPKNKKKKKNLIVSHVLNQ